MDAPPTPSPDELMRLVGAFEAEFRRWELGSGGGRTREAIRSIDEKSEETYPIPVSKTEAEKAFRLMRRIAAVSAAIETYRNMVQAGASIIMEMPQ